MANTLKFGNGEWYGKKDTILAYNDENSNYKPLPFDFSRGSTPTGSKATTINKDGLIEEVGNNVPRIDYKDNSKGALLLEPSRTNKALYSEDFSQSFWTKSNASVVSGFSSPDGNNNAYKLVEAATNSEHYIRCGFIGTTDGGSISPSIFVKSAERSQVVLQESAYTGQFMTVDLIAETISTNGQNANLTKLADGWFRIDFISIGRPSTRWKVSPAVNLTSTYQGDGTSGIYIFGFQLEDNVSYPTSYIPTQGSAVTRLVETCIQTPPSGVIGQTEGTMYAQVGEFPKEYNGRVFAIGDGTGNEYITIIKNGLNNNFAVYATSGGSVQDVYQGSGTLSNNSKIAVGYKNNDYAIYVNGTQVHTNTNASVPSLAKVFIGSRENGSPTYSSGGSIADTRLYNTRLTNSELASLTQV